MDRRSMIGASIMGSGGLALAGCAGSIGAPAGPDAGLASDAEVRRRVSELERQLGEIERQRARSGLLADALGRVSPDVAARGERLAKRSLRTILLASSFGDLSIAEQVHPASQGLVDDHLDEMEETTTEMLSFLSSLTPTARADMARAFRARPTLTMDVIGEIDAAAGGLAIPAQRRVALRAAAVQVASRMKQSSELFLDDCVRRTEKLMASDLSLAAVERRLVARLGEQELLRIRDEAEVASRTWQLAEGSASSDAAGAPRERSSSRGHNARKRRRLTIAGAVTLGLSPVLIVPGSVILAVGGSIAATGLICLIPGLIALIAGLVVLIVGQTS